MTTQIEKSNLQHDYILIDSSSSMSGKWLDSLAAVDAYMAVLRADHVRSRVILHMIYDMNPDYIHREVDSDAWTPLVQEAPQPCGGTPLYNGINFMGLRLRSIDPPRCSILIVTDGEDTTRESGTSLAQARAILDWCRAKGWQVTFIGADFSNSSQARALGSDRASAIGVQRRLLPDAAAALARKRAAYGLYGTPMHYTDAEQTQFGGYLSAPGA
jgi:hypothetical protein